MSYGVIETLDLYSFRRRYELSVYKDDFSYEALEIIFNDLEARAERTQSNIELDYVAIRSEYNEYRDIEEWAENCLPEDSYSKWLKKHLEDNNELLSLVDDDNYYYASDHITVQGTSAYVRACIKEAFGDDALDEDKFENVYTQGITLREAIDMIVSCLKPGVEKLTGKELIAKLDDAGFGTCIESEAGLAEALGGDCCKDEWIDYVKGTLQWEYNVVNQDAEEDDVVVERV